MLIADPSVIDVTIYLPPEDAVELEAGADGEPDPARRSAVVRSRRRSSARATRRRSRPDGTLAYVVRAQLRPARACRASACAARRRSTPAASRSAITCCASRSPSSAARSASEAAGADRAMLLRSCLACAARSPPCVVGSLEAQPRVELGFTTAVSERLIAALRPALRAGRARRGCEAWKLYAAAAQGARRARERELLDEVNRDPEPHRLRRGRGALGRGGLLGHAGRIGRPATAPTARTTPSPSISC